jgi:hypothetical protein
MDNDDQLKGMYVDGCIQAFSVSPFYVSLYGNRQLDIRRFIKLSEGSVLDTLIAQGLSVLEFPLHTA